MYVCVCIYFSVYLDTRVIIQDDWVLWVRYSFAVIIQIWLMFSNFGMP